MKKKEHCQMIIILLKILLVSLITTAFGYLWFEFYTDKLYISYYNLGNWTIILLYGILYLFLCRIYSAFRVGYYSITELIYTHGITLFLTNALAYIVICLLTRHLTNILWILLLFAIQVLCAALWAYASNQIFFKANPRCDMLVIYKDETAKTLLTKMKAYPEKYHVAETINIQSDIQDIKEKIKAYQAVLLCDLPTATRNILLKFCVQKKIRVYLTPEVSDILISGANRIHLFDTPLLLCDNASQAVTHRFAKRLIDLIVSTVMIIVFSPFMLFTIIAIKVCDHGSILYKQERLTQNAKTFNVYKFRSMVEDAEKDGVARLSSKNDDRITPVGKFIRATRLDELPQLFNIFKGDMTLVGPRPERPEIAKKYCKTMPEFALRLQVKAGLTGYAQIFGKYNTTPKDKLKLDLMYIADNSLFLDFKILFLTFKTMFMKESTEGIEDGAVTAGDVK